MMRSLASEMLLRISLLIRDGVLSLGCDFPQIPWDQVRLSQPRADMERVPTV